MASISLGDISSILLRSISIILFITIYIYIVHLENIGCKCATNSDTTFIKNFSLFGSIYMLITIFFPHSVIQSTGNSTVSFVLSLIDILFNLVAIYFFYVTYRYTRYLVNEKCKCSEDIRREIISIGSIIIFMLLFFFVVLQILIAIIFGAINGALNSISKTEKDSHNVLRNPIDSLTKLPSKLKQDFNDITSSIKNTSKKIKNTINSNKKR